MNARSIAVAALLVVSFAVFGCSQSPEARRKEAQANADKFLEFIKANDPEGAYRNTFSSTYKSQQSLDSWVRFCQGMSHTTGPIVNYQVVKYDAPAGSPAASASRSMTTTRSPRRSAARAWARPTMPAPTIARS